MRKRRANSKECRAEWPCNRSPDTRRCQISPVITRCTPTVSESGNSSCWTEPASCIEWANKTRTRRRLRQRKLSFSSRWVALDRAGVPQKISQVLYAYEPRKGVNQDRAEISVGRQCALLVLLRTTIYYRKVPVCQSTLRSWQGLMDSTWMIPAVAAMDCANRWQEMESQ